MCFIFSYFVHMLPAMLVSLPLVTLIRFLSRRRHPTLRFKISHEIGCLIFTLFLIGLAGETVVPKSGLQELSFSNMTINLLPFRIIADTCSQLQLGNTRYLVISLLGNIFIFFPIGFLLPLLWKRYEHLGLTALTVFCISLFIEAAQLPLARSSDIDDLILNTLGGVIGFFLWLLLRNGFPRAAKAFRSD